MRYALALLPFVLATACEPLPQPDPSLTSCGADGFQVAVGGSIAAISLPAGQPMRIIRPGDMVTQDYRPDRINFDVDANGTITRVWCG